ncbi:MAG: hypothetical protein LBC13_04275, partial [Clostridiales bacterium]|nr:hypothetical protein [Clostridiales bacterium]
LRLYDSDFIIKLGALMEREQENYRNKNEFLTALLRRGYEGYAAKEEAEEPTSAANETVKERDDDICAFLRVILLYQEVQQKLLSSVYRMVLAVAGGERVIKANVESGFFDDLPARFGDVIFNLKARFDLL